MYTNQTPIDIHCSKIVDWLVQRRHCKKDWGENLASIRRKIKAALGDMPENEEMKQLLIGSKLDYFKTKRIVEILQTTEAGSKNFFGYYSSQRMKDWQDILGCYERDCIYLAEVATDLIRETNYEIPGIRKLLNRLKQEKDDLTKDKANMLRKAQQFNSEHQKIAQSYGIKGVDVSRELFEKSKSLSTVMNDIAQLSSKLGHAVEYYRDCSKLISKQEGLVLLSMLDYVIKHGNTSVYEWTYGEKPSRIEITEKAPSSGTSNPSEIELVDDEIDFGDDLPSSGSSSGFVHVDKVSDNGNGCKIEESFVKLDETDPQVTSNLNEKVARDDEAKLVLEFRKSRCQFLNNLYELEAFLSQCLCNLTNTGTQSNTFTSEEGSGMQRYNSDEISTMLTTIRSIFSIFDKEENRILFQMNDSPLFVDNIREKLANKLKQASDCTAGAELISERIEEIDKQIRDTELNLKKCISASKEMQRKVESSLRDIYGGRPINIMGCVS